MVYMKSYKQEYKKIILKLIANHCNMGFQILDLDTISSMN